MPKDTKQLLKNYESVPNSIIKSIVSSNSIRKDFIADSIMKRKIKTVGVYRLIMKFGSDNWRNSAIKDVISRIKSKGLDVIVYETTFEKKTFFGLDIVNDIAKFKEDSDLIIANRIDNGISDVISKVYSRDLFNRD